VENLGFNGARGRARTVLLHIYTIQKKFRCSGEGVESLNPFPGLGTPVDTVTAFIENRHTLAWA